MKPHCENECGALLKRKFHELGFDAHVTHVPPLQPFVYEDLAMSCPHGVRWYAEPTSEQRVAWAKDGVA